MDPIAEAPAEPMPVESAWRLLTRLILDVLGFAAIASAILILLAAIAAVADVALRGMDGAARDMAFVKNFPGNVDMETFTLVSFSIGCLFYVAIILAILVIARLRRGSGWRDYVAWRPFRPDWTYLLLAAAGIGWGIAIGSFIETLHPEAKNWFVFPKGVVGVAVSFVLVAILGPLSEEFLFRGWLFTALRPKFGVIATILVTAALFAMAHWESTHLYAMAVFPVGLLLGYARERSGGMRATFAFHGIYNFSGWILAAFAGK